VPASRVLARPERSLDTRSFLALGAHADRLPRFTGVARNRYGATAVDLTAVLLEALKDASAATTVRWSTAAPSPWPPRTSSWRWTTTGSTVSPPPRGP